MLFWTTILLLTAAAVMSVLLPLGRANAASADGSAGIRAVYVDQLAELERDRADGRISVEEAESARAEIARRLLDLTKDAGSSELGNAGPTARRAASLIALCGIPVVSLSIYLALGAPSLPGQPLATRLESAPAENNMAALVREVEAHLALQPEDGRGWDVIAPVYLRLGRADDAAVAYRNAARLLGATAARSVGLGEAIVTKEMGVVTEEAKQAFLDAMAADPTAASARFFLAVAKEQEGKPAEAAGELRALLEGGSADAPWRPMVEQVLARLESQPEIKGPSEQDILNAESMDESDRRAMIEGMVRRLAERLRKQPGDVEDWLRLVRAYNVLGQPAAASAAARSALQRLDAAEDRDRIGALVADLGLKLDAAAIP